MNDKNAGKATRCSFLFLPNRAGLIAGLIGLAGTALSIGLFLSLRASDRKYLDNVFHGQADDRIKVIERGFEMRAASLETLARLCNTRPAISAEEFQTFAADMQQDPAMKVVMWIPRTSVRDGIDRFQIAYAEPPSARQALLGQEVGSSIIWHETLETARDIDAAVSIPVTSVAKEDRNKSKFLLLLPVYRSGAPHGTIMERRANLTGFVAGSFGLNELVTAALKPLAPAGIDVFVYSQFGTDSDALASHHMTRRGIPSGGRWSIASAPFEAASHDFFLVGRRPWNVLCRAAPVWAETEPRSQSGWILLSGMLLTSTGAIWAYRSSKRRWSIECIALERTGSLAESERRFSSMLGNLELVSMMLDRDARITWCNDYLLRQTGWQREEVIGRDWFEIFMPPALVGEVRGIFSALLADQPMAWHHENEILTRSGTRRLIRWNNSVLRSACGEVIGTTSIGEDITDRKQAEDEVFQSRELLRGLNANLEQRVAQRTEDFLAATEEAERANRAKSEFLSRTSHELRTPLNAILGFGQLLEMEENLSSETRESIEQILNAGRHLLTLIDEVLDISNAESGAITLSLEPVAVDQLIEETLCLIRSLDGTIQVQMERPSPPEQQWSVLADPKRLKQVLLNLLSNAIKYNRPGGKVTVEFAPAATDDPPAFRFSVRDTGPGISAENLPRLFTPFDRLGAERTLPPIPGTGLGLALCKRMVELMGGRIGVESVVDEGSTFWIEIPLGKNPAASLDQACSLQS